MFFGAIPPPRNFAKIHARGSRGLLPIQPKDSIPPWGHTGTRRARRGRFAGLSGADAEKARRAAGAGLQGRGGCPLPGRGGRRGQNGCTQRGLCRVSGHLCDRGGSAGEKARFCLIRKRFFSGRSSCQIRAVLRPNPCRFGRVAFSAARSDECVTPGGAGEKPRQKTKRPSERSAPHEKPDFRYRD